MVRDHLLDSPEATEAAGAALGALVRAGDAIGLIGDLGAGKTLLVRGLARGLGVPPEVRVSSPTFTLVNEYRGGAWPLFHVDLYRIEREEELTELGLEELWGGPGVVAVEWSDRFDVLPPDRMEVRLAVAGDEERMLSASGTGARSRELAVAWERAL